MMKAGGAATGHSMINLIPGGESKTSLFIYCSGVLLKKKTFYTTYYWSRQNIVYKKTPKFCDYKNLFVQVLEKDANYNGEITWSLVSLKMPWPRLHSLQMFSLQSAQKCVAILYGISGQVPQSAMFVEFCSIVGGGAMIAIFVSVFSSSLSLSISLSFWLSLFSFALSMISSGISSAIVQGVLS